MNARTNRSRSNNSGASNRKGGSRNRNRKRSRNSKVDPAKFWGDPAALPTPEHFDTDSLEPLAIVHSLGRAPLPGVVAEPYFAAVYDRAAGLASVLGDAAGLDDLGAEGAEAGDGAGDEEE